MHEVTVSLLNHQLYQNSKVTNYKFKYLCIEYWKKKINVIDWKYVYHFLMVYVVCLVDHLAKKEVGIQVHENAIKAKRDERLAAEKEAATKGR